MFRFIITFALGMFTMHAIDSGRINCRLGNAPGCSLAPGWDSGMLTRNDVQPERWTEPQSHGSFRATSNPVPLHSR